MSLFDAWVSLRHGGQLLSPSELDSLPEGIEKTWGLETKLRSEFVELINAQEGAKK